MASTAETGHGKNVANFGKLVMSIATYGTRYNPSKTMLTIADCQTELANAQKIMSDINLANGPFVQAKGLRESKFGALRKFSTRILNAAEASNAQRATIEAVRSLNKKLQGVRIGKKPSSAPTSTEGDMSGENATPKTRSTSQQSFDLLLDNFGKLVALLQADAGYKPNEPELAATGLGALLTELAAINRDAIQKEQDYNKLVVSRNRILYSNENSLHARFLGIKKYIKSVFGGRSKEYLELNEFPFRAVRV